MKRYALPLLIGFLGVALGLLALHAYHDHRDHHAMLDFLNRVTQQQAGKAASPAPAPAPSPAQ